MRAGTIARLLLAAIVMLLGLCHAAHAQPTRAVQAQRGVATVQWLQQRLTIKEGPRNNSGPEVSALVKAGGGNPAIFPEWCGFTQAACQRAYKLPIPAAGMQGAARAWFQIPARRVLADSAKPGHVAGFDYGKGIHHITRVVSIVLPLRKGRTPRAFYTIGGNEGRYPNAGMHLTYYPTPNIAAFANWLY